MSYITKEGLEKVKKELQELKSVKRKELTERLRRAIAFGDLSENFDYDNAKEDQEMLERRIAELEDTLANAQIVQSPLANGVVQVGNKVALQEGKKRIAFSITGPQEANPLEGKLSAESPLGQALLGRKKGETVEAETPNGTARYKIVEIE